MFVDDEAELGSDDEEHDDTKKRIDADDMEENEDDLDKDLEGFVVQGGDDAEIGEGNDEMMQKFLNDRHEDDRKMTQKIFSSIILGNNKKRKRGEVELDDLDEFSKRKLQRIEERANAMSDADSDVMFDSEERA